MHATKKDLNEPYKKIKQALRKQALQKKPFIKKPYMKFKQALLLFFFRFWEHCAIFLAIATPTDRRHRFAASMREPMSERQVSSGKKRLTVLLERGKLQMRVITITAK